MCSLQEHIEREARERAAAAGRVEWCGNIKVHHEKASAPTFEAMPSTELTDIIGQAVREQLVRRAADIELHCAMGLMLGYGVRVKQYQDGSYEIAIDSTVPAREIYEEHPDQPAYGMIFED
jgi:hypothetical protein